MGDESNQTKDSEDSNEAKIVLLNKKVNVISSVNQVLRTENLDKAKQIENAERVVTYLIKDNDKLELQVKTLKQEIGSYYSRMNEYACISDYLQDQLTSTKDQLTSVCEEKDALRSVNNLLTKSLQTYKKDLSDCEKIANDFIDKTSEIEDMKLQNEKLKSELENARVQKETSPSEVDKLMVLYQCSERENYIASMKLLDAEENMRRLRNELQSQQNFMVSQKETESHSNKSNGENVQAFKPTDFDVESEVIDTARAVSSIKNGNLVHMIPINESEKSETSATQISKEDIRFLQEEILGVIGKADEFYEKFEEKFEEKRSCLLTKLTSCDDQIQELKKLCMKLKKEKLVLLDVMKEMNGFLPDYSEQLEHFKEELAKGAEEVGILRRKTRDFETKVKSLQEFTGEILR